MGLLLAGEPMYWAERVSCDVYEVYRPVTWTSDSGRFAPLEAGGGRLVAKSQSDSRSGELLKVPNASRLKLSSFISSHRLPEVRRIDHVKALH